MSRMKTILILVAFGLFSCENRTTKTTHPPAIQLNMKNEDGVEIGWKCLAVSGGGAANVATPADLDIWNPVDNKCYKDKK